jgi:hypothetical protein
VRSQRFGAAGVTFAQLEARLGERSRKLRFLEKRTACGDENPDFAAADSL